MRPKFVFWNGRYIDMQQFLRVNTKYFLLLSVTYKCITVDRLGFEVKKSVGLKNNVLLQNKGKINFLYI